MNSDSNDQSNKNYTLKPTYTPLSAKTSNKNTRTAKKINDQTIIRDSNEDDDLYDPYSDYHDGTLRELTFDKDPWK